MRSIPNAQKRSPLGRFSDWVQVLACAAKNMADGLSRTGSVPQGVWLSLAAPPMAALWKALLEHVVSQEESDIDIDADSLVSGCGDPAQGGRM